MKKALFICKKRLDSYGISFGLLNSATFVSNYLSKHGIESKVVQVIDNNNIDKEVKQYKPTHVFIEALWVVPQKFNILLPLYPNVEWIVRIHSKIPFLANEGIALDWLYQYEILSKTYKNFHISTNSERCFDDLKDIGIKNIYLPNIYSVNEQEKEKTNFIEKTLDVGCFGAIRPFKNHLTQAIAAIEFAEQFGLDLRFHINATRTEQRGERVLDNLRALFKNTGYKLIEHSWVCHKDFMEVIRNLDIGMQVSFSETFNIVTADCVYNNVPVVVSKEIEWLPFWTKANPNSSDSIRRIMAFNWIMKPFGLYKWNRTYLDRYNSKAGDIWLNYLR